THEPPQHQNKKRERGRRSGDRRRAGSQERPFARRSRGRVLRLRRGASPPFSRFRTRHRRWRVSDQQDRGGHLSCGPVRPQYSRSDGKKKKIKFIKIF
ncbi:MAG: hypothetical protein BJ554DRAFT_19, partial [Olpidium bornovanus]